MLLSLIMLALARDSIRLLSLSAYRRPLLPSMVSCTIFFFNPMGKTKSSFQKPPLPPPCLQKLFFHTPPHQRHPNPKIKSPYSSICHPLNKSKVINIYHTNKIKVIKNKY